MDVKNVEGLPNVLDNNTDEWHATLKVGIVGATALSEVKSWFGQRAKRADAFWTLVR